ncbi:hypothetical protein BANRA_05150 [Klebsiella pneumoniae]|nr:hypothetical protein BANRA_05150 [Klebsiella pneumoniae]
MLSRLCVRRMCGCSAFPLAPLLRSTDSAPFGLFACFAATMSESDFSSPYITGYDSSSSRCGPSPTLADGQRRSPGSRVEIVLTCGLRPRRVHVALAVSHPMMLPSVNSTTSAPGNLIYISWLNGWPVNTPVNASPHTSRYATHDSGTLWIAGPSMVGDFHPLISTGLPAHTVYIWVFPDHGGKTQNAIFSFP